jgi:four helix bundle protein
MEIVLAWEDVKGQSFFAGGGIMLERKSSGTITFEMLEAWQKARVLVQRIYGLTRRQRIRHDYGLCDQTRRAGVSIMSNIAEGFERTHLREKLQFYNIARGSSAEIRSLLYVIEDNYPEFADELSAARSELTAAGQLVSGLIRSTRRRQCLNVIACTISFLLAWLVH